MSERVFPFDSEPADCRCALWLLLGREQPVLLQQPQVRLTCDDLESIEEWPSNAQA